MEYLQAGGRGEADDQGRRHGRQPPPEADRRYPADQPVQRRAGSRAAGVVRPGLGGHVGGNSAEQARQPGQSDEFLTASRASRQMLVYLGALSWPDRAEYIHAEFVTGLRAVVGTINFWHGGCPGTRRR